MDDVSDIRDMYDANWDREDSRLQRHQLERDITWRYLERYLPASGRVLEVGTGTGHYTLELARRGYEVLAVDLAPELVRRVKERVTAAGLQGRVEVSLADGRCLAGVAEDAFEAVLLMGPLYHLVRREERLLALQRARACLRTGGILFSAFLSRYGCLGDQLRKGAPRGEQYAEFESIVRCGCQPARRGQGQGFRGYWATVEEIAPLHTEAGFEAIVVAGVEPAISADDESYNRLEGRQREFWLDLLFRVSAEPSMVASSRHLLYVGRRSPNDAEG